jgi:hypothetical protein
VVVRAGPLRVEDQRVFARMFDDSNSARSWARLWSRLVPLVVPQGATVQTPIDPLATFYGLSLQARDIFRLSTCAFAAGIFTVQASGHWFEPSCAHACFTS